MQGRIYKIEGGGKFYIGSTIQDINKRLKNHRSKSKESSRLNTPLYKHFNEFGWENAIISVMEEFIITDKLQLLERENELIKSHLEDNDCLNSNRVKISMTEKKERDKVYGKERRKLFPEKERERLNKWRKDNPEKRKEQLRRYYENKSINREKEI